MSLVLSVWPPEKPRSKEESPQNVPFKLLCPSIRPGIAGEKFPGQARLPLRRMPPDRPDNDLGARKVSSACCRNITFARKTGTRTCMCKLWDSLSLPVSFTNHGHCLRVPEASSDVLCIPQYPDPSSNEANNDCPLSFFDFQNKN